MPTFRRLLGFLRPYRRQVIGSLVFAWLAMGMTVLIPFLVGETVDKIEPPGVDRDALLPLALAIIGAGILRLGLTVVRRLIAGKVSLAVEFDLRDTLDDTVATLAIRAHKKGLELASYVSEDVPDARSAVADTPDDVADHHQQLHVSVPAAANRRHVLGQRG